MVGAVTAESYHSNQTNVWPDSDLELERDLNCEADSGTRGRRRAPMVSQKRFVEFA
jgi:hypothetical protein